MPPPDIDPATAGTTAAFAAFRLVSDHMGTAVSSPEAAGDPGHTSPARMARTRGIRTRTVRLEDSWWRHDLGPLIGYRKDDDTPVALLPARRGYRIVIAGEGVSVPVTATTAARLRERATMLYRPLPTGTNSIRSLVRFGLRGAGGDVLRIVATAVATALISVFVAYLGGALLSRLVHQAQPDRLVPAGLLVIVTALVLAALTTVGNISALRLRGRAESVVQAAVWDRLLSLPASFFTGSTAGRPSGSSPPGFGTVPDRALGEMMTALTTLLCALANLLLLYVVHPALALLGSCLVATVATVCLVVQSRITAAERTLRESERRASATARQLLRGISVLKAFGAQRRAFERWTSRFLETRRRAQDVQRARDGLTVFNTGFPLVSSAVVFAAAREVPAGSLLTFFIAMHLALAATQRGTTALSTLRRPEPEAADLLGVLHAEPETTPSDSDPGELGGAVAFESVSFRYAETEPPALRDVSFSVDPGEFVAIVGPTGCGKSTVLRMLLGFDRPTAGAVRYDGQDLTELNVTAVRRQCGVVLQHGSLLPGDIADNIIGDSGSSRKDAWEAARRVGVAGDIERLPMGMETVVGEGGAGLSGGQRQQIMLARALVSEPRIVLLDEATSALDNPAQRLIADNIAALRCTRIVIAHRLSTVGAADRILVLDRGELIQQGDSAALLEQPGSPFERLTEGQRIDGRNDV
ncbi:NHLM bacteriocin system ABC transporter ATP-binding protein [Saccharopolyspora lacisalsi]|uniref:NHLM bacteriocin system ABC transporter ATP-binding protein n=1 Tax=Halosaccharopolyspora lacisalsi TaxID=1000566 RepID=A0A839DZX9_9PSEU|nr:ATP-binding cassette domain-containing protein [Halosaccharopolyspora lacisalsi]MBA8827502.1 NHLM bacteriocin system ABC transporter ATP-binding protein [Halosaccharopolyspora lacisalsi]